MQRSKKRKKNKYPLLPHRPSSTKNWGAGQSSTTSPKKIFKSPLQNSTFVFHFLPFSFSVTTTTSSSSPPPPSQNILTHSHHLHLRVRAPLSLSHFLLSLLMKAENWKLSVCTRKYTQYRSTQEEKTWLHRQTDRQTLTFVHFCSAPKEKEKRNKESKVCVSAAKFLNFSPLVH